MDNFIVISIGGVNYWEEYFDNYVVWFDEIFDFCDIFVGLIVNDCIFLVIFDFYENVEFIYDDEGNVIGVEGILECNFNEVYLFKLVNVGVFFFIDMNYGKVNLLFGGCYDYFDVEFENGWVSLLGVE